MPPSIHDLQNTITYQFSNTRYLLEALRTAGAGYHGANSQSAIDGNKRLAYVGEAVLKMLLLEDWYVAGADRGQYGLPCALGIIGGVADYVT